jgi:hypothetical protein
MTTSSLQELRGRVAAGEYAIDSGELAGEILSKFALIRRVGRTLMSEDEAGSGEPGLRSQPRGPRGERPTQPQRREPGRERLA